MWVMSALFHGCYFLSVLDMHFRSPFVFGMTNHKNEAGGLAKRVVLFVNDGLRADTFYNAKPKFLTKILENEGTHGISLTRVPTESRPCFIAMCAGFYEDVSTVLKGFKGNTAVFDSIFNQSSYAWGFGNPDQIKLFTGNNKHMHEECYTEEMEVFDEEAAKMDSWVFDHVTDLLSVRKHKDKEINKKLMMEKSSYLLHLNAIDSLGHNYKPFSKEYTQHPKFVDEGVEKLVALFEKTFPDHSTAYIFTADHGLNDWGSHGGGDSTEIETPLVMWGAGIKKPIKLHHPIQLGPKISKDNAANNYKSVHIMQADISAIMASLIGVNFPANSIGIATPDIFDASTEWKARNTLANTKSVFELYNRKQELKSKMKFYLPYGPLKYAGDRFAAIEKDIKNKLYPKAILDGQVMMKDVQDGIVYIESYDKDFLRIVVTTGYISWIAYLGISIIYMSTSEEFFVHKNFAKRVDYCFCFIAAFAIIYLALRSAPINYYLYMAFPIFFINQVIRSFHFTLKVAIPKTESGKLDKNKLLYNSLVVLLAVFVAQTIASSFFDRSNITYLVLIIALWPLFDKTARLKFSPILMATWIVSFSLLSIFPRISRNLIENPPLIFIGGLGVILIGLLSTFNFKRIPGRTDFSFSSCKAVYTTQLSLIICSLLLTTKIAASLGFIAKLAAWVILIISVGFLFLLPNKHYFDKFVQVILCLACPFILMTKSYEALFLVILGICVVCWVFGECIKRSADVGSKKPEKRFFGIMDFRTSIFYMILTAVAFFGNGNEASISSFELSPTLRFVTVFSPFTMMGLLLFKLFIPFVVVAAGFEMIFYSSNTNSFGGFSSFIWIAEYLSIYFFYRVKEVGSWLEIGSALAHYSVANFMIVLQITLFLVTKAIYGSVKCNKNTKEGTESSTNKNIPENNALSHNL